ncbi:hypothetical protein NY751_19905 [Xanthomonas campestris]|nr:hypothetical protein [Xanthomonas campestris]MDC8748286.1 hypothetical protein [Xanthomonas campestris]MEA9674131.1 hypothetical protein [Xanthomonas campestris pv. raphani]
MAERTRHACELVNASDFYAPRRYVYSAGARHTHAGCARSARLG